MLLAVIDEPLRTPQLAVPYGMNGARQPVEPFQTAKLTDRTRRVIKKTLGAAF